MRADPPEGFHTIWSRLIDVPAAAVILSFQHFIGQMRAALLASVLLPLIEALLLFDAASAFARPLVGRRYAKLVTLFVLFSSCFNAEYFTLAGFQVGTIGHHGWYVLLTLTLFGRRADALLLNPNARDTVIGGAAIGVLLAIGIEGLPLIAGLCLLMALRVVDARMTEGRPQLTHLPDLGALLGLALLPANQPPDHLWTVSFAEPSVLGPLLVSCATCLRAVSSSDDIFRARKRPVALA